MKDYGPRRARVGKSAYHRHRGSVPRWAWRALRTRFLEYYGRFTGRRINLSWVTPNLACGGQVSSSLFPKLRDMGVTAVVDMRQEARDPVDRLLACGISLYYLPTPDLHAADPSELKQAADWVLNVLNGGGKVFVHCQHGIGRGPLMACAILVRMGYQPWDAVRVVKEKRWQVALNRRQLETLLAFAQQSGRPLPAEARPLPGLPHPLPKADGVDLEAEAVWGTAVSEVVHKNPVLREALAAEEDDDGAGNDDSPGADPPSPGAG